MEEQYVEADVLCIGGGIAGLMAAIRAAELGAKVVVAEKGNTLSSGAARAGNDHFECYIPEVHGPDRDAFIDELLHGQKSHQPFPRDLYRKQFAKAFDIVKLWDSWGIPMKYKGKWEFAGHCFPGGTHTYLKYSGLMQKSILTEQALQRGVEIINRVMVFELLTHGDRVIGALGADTRQDKLLVFGAKSVILGTGGCRRLYPTITPGLLFNYSYRGTSTGDGRAMAFRAGAELRNVEMSRPQIGPKYFETSGQGTWVGVLKDAEGKPVGPFVTKPDRKYGDMMMEVNKLVAREYTELGKGPVYMDCTELTDEDYEYMMHWMVHEGNESLINHMHEEKIDVRRHLVEFGSYGVRCGGHVVTNTETEATLRGLYAAGDEAQGGISAAATFGWIGGENATSYSRETKAPDLTVVRDKIDQNKAMIDQLRGRTQGPDWKEVNIALFQVMSDYAGEVRYESLLSQGLEHLRRLRGKVNSQMIAKNPHELNRCLEVINLMDIGELVFISALERKETRGPHKRLDFRFTNPLLNHKLHIIKKVDGKAVGSWREIRP